MIIAEKLKEVTRTERKLYMKNQEYLTNLCSRFFSVCNNQPKHEIKKTYSIYKYNWLAHVKKFNKKIKTNYIDRNAFKINIEKIGISGVKKSKASSKAKLQLLRTIRIVKGTHNFLALFKDMNIWWKFYRHERTTLR